MYGLLSPQQRLSEVQEMLLSKRQHYSASFLDRDTGDINVYEALCQPGCNGQFCRIIYSYCTRNVHSSSSSSIAYLIAPIMLTGCVWEIDSSSFIADRHAFKNIHSLQSYIYHRYMPPAGIYRRHLYLHVCLRFFIRVFLDFSSILKQGLYC